MEDAKGDLDRCLEDAQAIFDTGVAACDEMLDRCIDGCNRLFRIPKIFCTLFCYYSVGKYCYAPVAAVAGGYAAGCTVYYAMTAKQCYDLYLRPPWGYDPGEIS